MTLTQYGMLGAAFGGVAIIGLRRWLDKRQKKQTVQPFRVDIPIAHQIEACRWSDRLNGESKTNRVLKFEFCTWVNTMILSDKKYSGHSWDLKFDKQIPYLLLTPLD